MVRVSITLTADEARRLIALSKQERRHPRDQAAVLLGERLRRVKLSPADAERIERAPVGAGGHA